MHRRSDAHPDVGQDERVRKHAAGQPASAADLPLRHFVLLYCLAIAGIAVIIVLVTTLPRPGAHSDDTISSDENAAIIEQGPAHDE